MFFKEFFSVIIVNWLYVCVGLSKFGFFINVVYMGMVLLKLWVKNRYWVNKFFVSKFDGFDWEMVLVFDIKMLM